MSYQVSTGRSTKSPEKIWRENVLQCAIDNVFVALSRKYSSLELETLAELDYSNYVPTSSSSWIRSSDVKPSVPKVYVSKFANIGSQEFCITEDIIGKKAFQKLQHWTPTSRTLYFISRGTPYAIKPTGASIPWCSYKIEVHSGVNVDFIKLLLSAETIQKSLRLTMRGLATPFLHAQSLNKLQIPLPPLEVQQKIVDLLEPIEKAAKMDWLSTRGFTRAEDLHKDVLQVAIDNVYTQLSLEFLENFSSVCEVSNSAGGNYFEINEKRNFNSEEMYWMYTHSDISDGKPTHAVLKKDFTADATYKNGRIALPVPYGNILGYRPLQVETSRIQEECVIRGQICKLLNGDTLTEYIRFILKSTQVAKFLLTSVGTQGTVFDWSRWNKLQIPLPPLEIQQKIVMYLSAIEESSKKLKENAISANKTLLEAAQKTLRDRKPPIFS